MSTSIDTSYGVTTTYDGSGRVEIVQYPTGFMTKNVYNGYGHLWKVQRDDSGDGTVF